MSVQVEDPFVGLVHLATPVMEIFCTLLLPLLSFGSFENVEARAALSIVLLFIVLVGRGSEGVGTAFLDELLLVFVELLDVLLILLSEKFLLIFFHFADPK